jgi:hypothetical protein
MLSVALRFTTSYYSYDIFTFLSKVQHDMTFLKQYNNANGLCLLITIYILENITDLQKKNVYFPPKNSLFIMFVLFLKKIMISEVVVLGSVFTQTVLINIRNS